VIRLVKAGLSDDIIIQQIRRKGPPREITADQIIALKNASVSERIIRAMLEPGAPAASAPPPAGAAHPIARPESAAPPKPVSNVTHAPAPVPASGAWTSHTDPMGFAVNQPPGWKVSTEPKLGRLSVQGERGERVIIWPMFMEKRQLDERQAGILVRQFAATLEAQMSWSTPRSSGRYVLTSARTAQRKSAVIMSWANSQSGSTILLYCVGAPADLYGPSTATFAGVLRSFRVLDTAAAAGGTPARRAALGPIQYVRWSDPLENAFSISVPRGWKVVGGMYRFSPTDSRTAVTLFSPEGGLLIKLGQKEFGAFMEPIGGMQRGSLPLSDGSSMQIQGYLSGQQFARYYVEHVRQECAGIRLASNNNRPDLVGRMSQEAQAQGYPAGQLTAGDVTFTWRAGQGTAGLLSRFHHANPDRRVATRDGWGGVVCLSLRRISFDSRMAAVGG